MQPATAKLWLKTAAEIVIAFGVLTALGTWSATAGIPGFLIDLLFWPADGAQQIASGEARLLAAIGGGVMVGWGVTVYLIVDRLYLSDPALVRTIVLAGVVTWFCVDSLGSAVAGAPLNVLGNTVFLVLFLVPFLGRAPARAKA